MLGLAGFAGADADVAAGDRRRRGAADPAEAVAVVPVRQAAGIGEQAPVAPVERRADAAQVGEAAAGDRLRLRLLEAREVEREIGHVVFAAEIDAQAFDRGKRGRFEKSCRRLVRRGEQVAGAPDRDQTRRRPRQQRIHLRGVAPQHRAAVERETGVVVGFLHGRRRLERECRQPQRPVPAGTIT